MPLIVICSGTRTTAYGPFPDTIDDQRTDSIEFWLRFHCYKLPGDLPQERRCRNGITMEEHHIQALFPTTCRTPNCNVTLNYDPDNRPTDLGLCYMCNDLLQEAELGLL